MDDQDKASFGMKSVENKHPQNFTIPKIKRHVDKCCLFRCSPNRREFGEILETLDNGRLNLASELKSSWTFSDIKLVLNTYLTERFREKRNEMKELGRHSRELEEKFCFLVVPNEIAAHIAQHGLRVGYTTSKELGNPELGVYLFRHIDVALNFAHRKKMRSLVILIFKVLFGKIKTVHPISTLMSALDPTPNFDSHISRKTPVCNASFDEQVTNSLIYVYEYDSSFKPAKTPRQCLPIAAVDASFTVNKIVTASVPVRLPSKTISSGNTAPVNCTVVKRIGKGMDAMVVFKSVCPPSEQASGIETALNNVSDKESPSVPVETKQSCTALEKSPLFQNSITLPDLSISLQQYNICIENLIKSCKVYTSKSMKDPRLLKRSEQETLKPDGQSKPCSVPLESNKMTQFPNISTKMNICSLEDINKDSLYLSFEERRVHDSCILSEEQFLNNLNKYSSFFTYIEQDRDSGIESLPSVISEEKTEHSSKVTNSDKLFGANSNQLGTEKNSKTEYTVSMSHSTSNCINKTSENGEKYGHNPCMFENPNLKDRDIANPQSANGKERDTSIESLPNTSREEKPEIAKQLCENDKLYKICRGQLVTERNHQTPLSDVMLSDCSKETNEYGGKFQTSPNVKNKATVKTLFLSDKEKAKEIKSLPNISSEKKKSLSIKLNKDDTFYRKHSNNVSTEKKQETQASVSMSLNTSHHTSEMVENGKIQVLDSVSPKRSNNKETKENGRKSKGSKCISQDTMLRNKAVAKTTRLIDYWKKHCMLSEKHPTKSNSLSCKTKPMNKTEECVTSIKQRSCGTGKYKSQVEPVKSHHKPADKNIAINAKTPTICGGSPDKFVSTATSHETIKYQKAKENCTLKTSLEKAKHEHYVPSGISEKADESTLKDITLDTHDDNYTPKSLSDGLDTQSTNEDVLHSSNKISYGTSRWEENIHSSQSSPIVISPTKSGLPSTDKSIQAPQSEKIRNQSLSFPKNTCEDVSNGDLCIVTDLENRIDWNTLFGMELEKVNATLITLQSSSLRKEKEPSGLRIFPDMEIIIPNNHFSFTGGYNNSIFGDMQPSMKDKEPINKTFRNVNNMPQDNQITVYIPGNQLAKGSTNLLDSKNCLKDILDPLSAKDVDSVPSSDIAIITSGFNNSIVGDMPPSIEAKEPMTKTFRENDMPPDNQRTDSIPGNQLATGFPNIQDSNNSFKDNLDPFFAKVVNSVQLPKNAVTSSPVPSKAVAANINRGKTVHKLDRPTVKKRLNKKKIIPSVLVKRSTRICKFSQSEENIKVVLGMLSDEIPLCKNKRISKKLDRAILHLRKAHKRVKKSLQLVSKTGGRRNLAKSSSVHKNLSVNGKEGNTKPVESTISQILQTKESSPNMKAADIQKSPTIDSKCLIESTQEMVNGASAQDSQHTKVHGSSPTKMSLAPSCKVSICSTETLKDPSTFSCVIASDKENTVPPLKSSSDIKEKDSVPCETDGKDRTLHKGGRKRKHASKRIFSQVRKVSSSLTISVSKCSNKKSHRVNEKNYPKGKRSKEFASVTTKGANTSGWLLQKMSSILQKASETDSLKSLQQCKVMCQKMIPAFIKAFEKKQHCALNDVIADRRLFVKKNLKTCFKCTLKPQAVEAFLELQMAIESRQFVESRMHYFEGRPTFRSLLWYDGSLYAELLSGESGYQQQSYLYSTFQEKLKLHPLTTLKNHCNHISHYLQAINENNSCYYVFLKYKRELQECEAVLKHSCDHALFSLSVPFSCGVNIGDTIDDLTTLQKSTLKIIRAFINLPTCNPGIKEHALSLLEFISAKIDYIKTSASTSIELSLFGIEHLIFDAAKVMAFNERKKYSDPKITISDELLSQINCIALSKLYEVYCVRCDQPANIKKSSSSEVFLAHKGSEFFGNQTVFFGKIIDQARCAEPNVLKVMIQDCNQHLECQSKFFQILQECIMDEVLIQESNVLHKTERQDKYTTLLKPEAVEAYIDLAMTYETLNFLNCLMASKKNQLRTRGLLWYDTSLFSDLIHSQNRVESYLQGYTMPNAAEIIDSTISEIKSELEIISECSESVNYSYAFQIMTRELSELSELKNFMKSKPAITTYINFSPFVASLHYGNSLTELDHNYNQLSDYLGVLLSAPKKDLGKLAHTMKIMKTIEFAKNLQFKPGISAFHFITCNLHHNRKKHRQALRRQMEEENQNCELPRKRLCIEMTAEVPVSSNSRRQKVITSPEKATAKEKEENQGNSHLRASKHITEQQQKEPKSMKMISVKGSPQKKKKCFLLSSPKDIKNYVHATSVKGRSNGKGSKISSLDEGKTKRGNSFAGKCPQASSMTNSCNFTLDSKVQNQTDSHCVESSPDSIGSGKASKQSDIQDKKARAEISEENDSSLDDNMSTFTVCTMEISTSDEQESIKQQIPAVGEEEQKDSATGIKTLQKDTSTPWNSQSISRDTGQYTGLPVSANPWQYSLYNWYQYGSNIQGYANVSYNTQSTNLHNQPSAFPVANSYITNQPYSGFSGQVQTQMYSIAGPFGTNMPYHYTDASSSSSQNPVQTPYPYSSPADKGWPWSSW
ncbi:testis-expressed protein 15 [Anomaloglossus baeobatrachus]|uniref:testis-expressed protein 15 n=1 Tax=Anomaloglossus baeobatrachus TaxID=238106 RepID=UPI003F4F65AF